MCCLNVCHEVDSINLPAYSIVAFALRHIVLVNHQRIPFITVNTSGCYLPLFLQLILP
jgi:hypothetical protein